MKFFIDILPIIISVSTFGYAIWIDSKRRKLENKLLEPQLSFNKVEKYGNVEKEENFLSYYVTKNNEITTDYPNSVLISIKNNSSGIAKNIQIKDSINSNLSISTYNNMILDIGGDGEGSILFKLSHSLYYKDQIFQFIFTYEDIKGRVNEKLIKFKIAGPKNRDAYSK